MQELEDEPANRPNTPEPEEMDPGLQGLPDDEETAGPDMDYVDYASDVLQYKQRFAGYLSTMRQLSYLPRFTGLAAGEEATQATVDRIRNACDTMQQALDKLEEDLG